MPPIAYADLAGPDGQSDNMGGTTQRIFFAPLSTFATISTPAAAPASYAASVEITAAHTFDTGKCFQTAYCTMDKGKLDLKSQGETDGKSFAQEGEIFFPGSKSAAHGFAALAKNDNFILMVETPDAEEEGYLQVGTAAFPAKIEPEFTLATNSSGVRGYTFKFKAMTTKQYVYTAAVSVTPAP